MIKKIIGISITDSIEPFIYNNGLLMLNEKKRQRIKSFKHFKDAERSLLGELLIRYLIKDEYNLRLDEICLSTNEYGKPFWPEKQDYHFNVSHSGQWVVGVSGYIPLGIDIEEIKEIDLSVMKYVLSDKEYTELSNKKNDEVLDFFYELWTFKESYIKALGKGMSIPLNSFSIYEQDTTANKQTFKQYKIDNNYKLNVCAIGKDIYFPDNITIMSNNDLIRLIEEM